MGYKINFKQSVYKDLIKIDKSIATIILDKIETELAEKVDQYPALKGKFAGLRKYRVGDYRVIFSVIEDDTVLILRVAHRKQVYR